MVITQLIGGLGNQMFQYAVGRHLARLRNCRLKLDLSRYDDRTRRNYGLRQYELKPFNIEADIATPAELEAFKPRGRLLSRLDKIKPLRNRIVRERFLHFDPTILTITGNVYLQGYWQSEKYFKDIESDIRKELTIRHEPDPINSALGTAIQSASSVSLHVRRGDYVSDPVTSAKFGPLRMEYYVRAVKLIAALVREPHFFIFSDDPQWVTQNIGLDYPTTYVNEQPGNHCGELRLMSLCKHHVIANSSFSWWGAWLNPRPDKTVIAPANWFQEKGRDTSDLVPEGWIRL
jgi:hypothetical protein